MTSNGEHVIALRPRTDEDNPFIERVTQQELVPVLEKAWGFRWDDGHARKFMLDLLTIGETLIVESARPPSGERVPIPRPDRQPIGYVWYILRPGRGFVFARPVFWLNYLVIAKPFQGQGVGAHVVAHCAQIARAARCRMMGLWVQAVNQDARRFYERLRFTPRREVDGNIPMWRRLQRGGRNSLPRLE